ncbi:hypothetical protein KC19_11G150500 [Ceratodon purpureus]|uniref:Uncharacterized protein n=1 Tax=Ceratodon purpureus TaxID=3225 RepID=A0A8T0GEM0_CERPU|nr:hypothetical protein KC19_11G150500 [Ceratodon purpureus]
MLMTTACFVYTAHCIKLMLLIDLNASTCLLNNTQQSTSSAMVLNIFSEKNSPALTTKASSMLDRIQLIPEFMNTAHALQFSQARENSDHKHRYRISINDELNIAHPRKWSENNVEIKWKPISNRLVKFLEKATILLER